MTQYSVVSARFAFIAALIAFLSSVIHAQVLPRLVKPDGGEKLVASSNVAIQWADIPATDTVGLDYSSDGGITWLPITEQATGLSYNWTVPNVASTRGLVRVRHRTVPSNSPMLLKSLAVPDSIVQNFFSFQDSTFLMTARKQYALYYLKNNFIPTQTAYTSDQIFDPRGAFHTDSLHMVSIGHKPGGLTPLGLVWARDGSRFGRNNEIFMTARLVDYSPKGTSLVATGDSIVGHVEAEYNAMYASYKRNGTAFTYARFGPVDTMYAVGCSDKSVDLVDVKSAQRIRSIPCGFIPDRISFTSDGTRMIVSGHGSGTVNVIELSTGNGVQSFAADSKMCVDMTLSTNDSLLATVGGDGTGRVWSMATGQQLYTIPQVGGKGLTTGLAFSHDGTRLATGERGYLAIWVLPGIAYPSSDISDATFTIQSVNAPLVTEADTIDFQQVTLGGKRDTIVEVVLKNQSDHPIAVSNEKIVGTDAAMFRILDEVLSYTILPGETWSTELRYTPSRGGIAHAQMWFEYGEAGSPATVELKGEGVTSLAVPGAISELAGTTLMPLRPNPAHDVVDIEFRVAAQGNVRIVLTDLRGREVTSVMNSTLEAGYHVVPFNLSGLASGQYYCTLKTANSTIIRRLTVVR